MIFIKQFHLKAYCCLLLALQLLPQGNGQASLAERHREFADALTDDLYVNDNDCTSSWGVSMLFDLLRPGTGSSEQTLNELCDVMGLCGPEDELLWNDTVNMLTTVFFGQCRYDVGEVPCPAESPTLKVANSIWIDDGSQLQSNYSDIVGEHLLQTDFGSQDAGGLVNSWVNASTLGLIDSIIDPGPIPYNLVAINSIYLKAHWTEPFSPQKTNEDLFFTDASRDEALPDKAHFMHAVRQMGYSDEAIPGYQIVRLEYVEGGLSFVPNEGYCRLSMVIALPFDINASHVTSEQVLEMLPFLDYRQVALALPKFKIESEYTDTLKSSLMTLGFTSAFVGDGFCGLNEGCQWIDLLIQKTFIELDEKGTVAAAATAAAFRGTPSTPPEVDLFLADHPFSFFIYSDCGDVVLFEGRVGAPSISTDWPAAQLQQTHSDPDFWTSNFDVSVSDVPVSSTTAAVVATSAVETKTTDSTRTEPITTTSSAFTVVPTFLSVAASLVAVCA